MIGVCVAGAPLLLAAEQQLTSFFTDTAPRVDGIADESVWTRAEPITVKDGASDIPITLRSVYSDELIYFLVTFPDEDESRSHRLWAWNDASGIYGVGPQREDCIVFKWFMGRFPDNFHIDSDETHTADIWFWKAHRTDPLGYADDKIQRLAHHKLKKAIELKSQSGKAIYLQRKGDQGRAAYADRVYIEYQGPVLRRFQPQTPEGSRADIRAKGRWQKGVWTVELSRRLRTGHTDDIQFDTTLLYLFGVTRYELAGRKPDLNTSQPLFGAGRLSEPINLRFNP